jgi:hypothetical protein
MGCFQTNNPSFEGDAEAIVIKNGYDFDFSKSIIPVLFKYPRVKYIGKRK